ncbi:MAG: hypothetical protein WKF58_07080 [Ilumatobacteraceae bacterium]
MQVLTPYPEGMSGRANDANADGAGNLVTGTLNIAPGLGDFWWYSVPQTVGGSWMTASATPTVQLW